MAVEYVFSGLKNFQACINREWIITNGLGGYCGSTIIGAHNRIHQGYLVASLRPPLERYLILSKTEEKITCGGRIFDLSTAAHKGEYSTEYNIGNQFLKSFKYDGCASFVYECGQVKLTKEVSLIQGENTCVVRYLIENKGVDAKLTITPLLNYRKEAVAQKLDNLMEEITFESLNELDKKNSDNKTIGFYFSPKSNKALTVLVATSEGVMFGRYNKYDANVQLSYEVENGFDGIDNHFVPVDFVIDVPAGTVKEVSFVCEVKKTTKKTPSILLSDDTAAGYIIQSKKRIDDLINQVSFDDDEFGNSLVLAADQFIVKNQATNFYTILAGLPGPSDCGRDVLISFTGLTLVTKRFEEAKQILQSMALQIKNGLIPNAFLNCKDENAYKSVDTSLLYFNAVYNYLNAVDNADAWNFVGEKIYPGLQRILNAFRHGTDYSIRMDEDGLLCAGSRLEQVTWMDFCDGEYVATPRHGKAVEINALWYNALMCMEYISRGLAKRGSKKAADYMAYAAGLNELATWVKDSFVKTFWYEQGGYLYDVVDHEYCDKSLRPNQIFAVSLPFTMLSDEKERAVFEVVNKELFVGVGIRSLNPDDEKYQSHIMSENFDLLCHQGPAWSFLIGAYIDAYFKVFGKNKQTADEARVMLDSLKNHLLEGCIGTIGEVFEGDGVSLAGGCFANAKSVGEVLRVLDIIQSFL